MKKVADDLPQFLSKIENSRPPFEHLSSTKLDKLVSNQNFMDKLRLTSEMILENPNVDMKEVIEELKLSSEENVKDPFEKLRLASQMLPGHTKVNSKDQVTSDKDLPPVILVKDNDLLEKMEKLSQMKKLQSTQVTQLNFGDFFPSKSDNNRVKSEFSPIISSVNSSPQSSQTKVVFPQQQEVRDKDVIFITEPPPTQATVTKDILPPATSQHLVMSQLIVQEQVGKSTNDQFNFNFI